MKSRMFSKCLGLMASSILLGGLFSISSYANGELLKDITYRENETIASVKLYNRYANTRYCECSIRKGQTRNSASTCAYTYGNLSPDNYIETEADVYLAPHVWAGGVVYNSQTPYSGIAWSDEYQLK